MLIEWIVREERVKVITIILREANEEDDQKTGDGTIYKRILIYAQLQIGERGQKQSWLGEVH